MTATNGNSHSPLISVSALKKGYPIGRQIVWALNGVDLEVDAGEFTVVMGPSGSGKSTLLYLLGGLDRSSAGSIRVADHEIEQLDENALADYRRKTIGFIFQSFNLIPSLTAEQNVAYPMRFANISRRERTRRARELLEQVGLGNRLQHRPTELSGGQQQRVAIARALVNNPQIVLADEPTGNLDSTSGREIMGLLSDLNQQGRTILMVTHDPRGARGATRTIRFLDGRVASDEQFDAMD
jgi:putative ABC transport system ATP-binding protein